LTNRLLMLVNYENDLPLSKVWIRTKRQMIIAGLT